MRVGSGCLQFSVARINDCEFVLVNLTGDVQLNCLMPFRSKHAHQCKSFAVSFLLRVFDKEDKCTTTKILC